MAFIELHFFSESLQMQAEAWVIMPQRQNRGEIGKGPSEAGGAEKYKCLYLLHGLSDDHTIWMRRTSIERYADRYGICVVMPCAHCSFYTDMRYGLKYYTYVAKELPEKIREFLNVSDKREDNFVAGLSMGGYGALKIGLRECDRFCACAGLSAGIDMETSKRWPVAIPVFGEDGVVPEDDDLFKLAEKRKNDPDKPRIFMGIGQEDFLYRENQEMRKTLEADGYDLTYRESHGSHNWDFWDEYICYVLEWMFGKR